MERETCRGAFSNKILEKAKEDKDIIVVCTDSRGSAQIGAFAKELPDQFVEMGIAEQNAVGVSAGLAAMGKKVFTVGPASFYSTRSAEQVKVDIAYSHNPVTVIGISGGLSYGALGATHHSLQDIAYMRAIPDMVVEIPADANQMRSLVDEFLKHSYSSYVRVGRGAVPVVYGDNVKVEIGKAVRWSEGKDAAIITCGQMLWRVLEAAKLLEKEGIFVSVVDMHTIKPLDREMVLQAAEECGCILTVEEHSIYGGLGSAVAELTAAGKPVRVSIAGIPDENVPNGSDDEVFAYYKLDPAGIADRVMTLLEK